MKEICIFWNDKRAINLMRNIKLSELLQPVRSFEQDIVSIQIRIQIQNFLFVQYINIYTVALGVWNPCWVYLTPHM